VLKEAIAGKAPFPTPLPAPAPYTASSAPPPSESSWVTPAACTGSF